MRHDTTYHLQGCSKLQDFHDCKSMPNPTYSTSVAKTSQFLKLKRHTELRWHFRHPSFESLRAFKQIAQWRNNFEENRSSTASRRLVSAEEEFRLAQILHIGGHNFHRRNSEFKVCLIPRILRALQKTIRILHLRWHFRWHPTLESLRAFKQNSQWRGKFEGIWSSTASWRLVFTEQKFGPAQIPHISAHNFYRRNQECV